MPDWFETLQDIGGALSGIPKGIDAGLAPFSTWEKIRGADLANDKSDIQLRDLGYLQDAREGGTDYGYYTDQAGAAQSGFQKTRAGNERDIYGIGQEMDMRQAMEDPEGIFQQIVYQRGLTPDMPEYRTLAAEIMSGYDPAGSIAAYDKMGVPAIEQRNLTQQAVVSFLQAKAPAGTQIIPQEDGTFLAIGKDGEEFVIPWQQAMAAAGMSGANVANPMKSVSEMLADQLKIQAGNTNAYKAVNPNNAQDTTQRRLATNSLMSAAQRDFDAAQREIAAIQKQAKDNFLDAEVVAELLAPVQQRAADAQRRGREAQQQLQQFQGSGGFGGGPAASRFGPTSGGTPRPQGGTSVTTRPRPGQGAARAAGGGSAAMEPPASMANPRPLVSEGRRDSMYESPQGATGQITESPVDIQKLIQVLQQLGYI